MDLYRKVRLACADGMSKRAAARHFNISRGTVDEVMAFSVPPGYRRTAPIKRPKLDGVTGIIDGWLDGDLEIHRKQRHTAKRVFERLRDEHGFTGGCTLRKVFYTVPSRLIGHHLRIRLYDDRLELFLGGTSLLTLPRGRASSSGSHGHVVNYHHVIHSLRKKQVRLRRNDRGCEAELAAQIEEDLRQNRPPDMAVLRALFSPPADTLPEVEVQLADLSSYDQLVGSAACAEEVAA